MVISNNLYSSNKSQCKNNSNFTSKLFNLIKYIYPLVLLIIKNKSKHNIHLAHKMQCAIIQEVAISILVLSNKVKELLLGKQWK